MTDNGNGKLVTITPDPWSPDAPQDPNSTTWAPIDLGPYISGEIEEEKPTVLQRADGSHLLYAGRVNAIVGETESAKTWLALEAARQEIEAGNPVAYLDFEDTPVGIATRLLALGVEPDALRERFRYISPQERISVVAWHALVPALDGVTLAVLDGVTEAMSREGLELRDNSDVQRFYDLLPRPLARAGPAVVTLDHVPKDRESRGRYALGGQHKLAGINGASYSLEVVLPFGRGRDGLVRMKVTKDRLGGVRGLPDGGNAEVKVSSDGTNVALEVIPAPAKEDGAFRPTVLMERVSCALEDADSGLSLRAILDGVRGKQNAIRLAVSTLVEEGFVTVESGPRGSHIHRSTKPYRQDEEDPP